MRNWRGSFEGIGQMAVILGTMVAILYAIYFWLRSPQQAPIRFSIGFVVASIWIARMCLPRWRNYLGEFSSKVSGQWLLDRFGHLLLDAAFLVFFGSLAGGLLGILGSYDYQEGDCAPGVPVRYC